MTEPPKPVSPHDFGPSIPGAGEQRVCRKCGAREDGAAARLCVVTARWPKGAISDYDPLGPEAA